MFCITTTLIFAQTQTTLHNFRGAPNDGQHPTDSLIADKAGNLYGATHREAGGPTRTRAICYWAKSSKLFPASRLAVIHKRAKDELNQIQLQQRERTEMLVETLDSLLDVLSLEKDRAAGLAMRALVGEETAIEQLRANYAAIRAWSNNNYLPLLWTHYRSHRQVLIQAIQSLRLETPTFWLLPSGQEFWPLHIHTSLTNILAVPTELDGAAGMVG